MWSAKSSISSGTWGRRRGRRRERRRGKHVLGRVSNTHSTYHRTTHHAPNSSAAYSISTHRAYTHRAGFLRSSRLLSVPSSECALRTGRPSCGCTCWCSSSACPPLGQGSRAISSELMFPSALSARPMTYLGRDGEEDGEEDGDGKHELGRVGVTRTVHNTARITHRTSHTAHRTGAFFAPFLSGRAET